MYRKRDRRKPGGPSWGARFLAARMLPGIFSKSFLAYSDAMIHQSPNRALAGQVAVLQFLHEHSFDQRPPAIR